MKLQYLVDNYNEMSAEDKKAQLQKISGDGYIHDLYQLTKGKSARLATRIMADMGSKLQDYAQSHTKAIIELLHYDDPKVRMHAAQIIGNTCARKCLDSLIDALEREEQMFALPSYLLAIGNAKNTRAKEYLENYMLRSDIDKHLYEEKAALTKALSNYVAKTKVQVRILPNDFVFLSTPNANVTYAAFKRLGFAPKRSGKYVAITGLERFGDIYATRAFCDAYIYLGKCPTAELDAFIAKRENAIIQRTGATGYRLEVKSVSHEVRLDIIKKCIAACTQLINTPSSYSIELMIDIDGDEAQVLLNPLVDRRFDYRKKTVAASINAGIAACVCEYASEYFDEDARVLDTFCGSGTMLFERSFFPHHTLTGVDINIGAIEAASENSRFSHAHPQFHHMDTLKFTAKRYDEIITNMPFGLRVGSHTQNERLYQSYFRILPRILNKEGLAILYTHEKKLTERLIEASGQFDILKHATFDAGGLYPAVYILRKRKDIT